MQRFKLTCQGCGSFDFSLPDRGKESTPVLCNNCGAQFATLGELRTEMAAQSEVTRQSDADSAEWLRHAKASRG